MPRTTNRVGPVQRATMRAMTQLSRAGRTPTYRELADRLGCSLEAAKGRVSTLKIMGLWRWEIALRQSPVPTDSGDDIAGLRRMVESNRSVEDAAHIKGMRDGRAERDDTPPGVVATPCRPARSETTADLVRAYRREWRVVTGRARKAPRPKHTHGMPAYEPAVYKYHACRMKG